MPSKKKIRPNTLKTHGFELLSEKICIVILSFPLSEKKSQKQSIFCCLLKKKVFVRTFALSIRASHIMGYKTTHVDKWYEEIVFFPSVNGSFYVCNKKNQRKNEWFYVFYSLKSTIIKNSCLQLCCFFSIRVPRNQKSFFKGDYILIYLSFVLKLVSSKAIPYQKKRVSGTWAS